MAGIYIHLPFCKQKCIYCDFYSIVSLNQKAEIIDALIREIELRKDYLHNEIVETIYFGGGTPSILNKSEIEKIIAQIYKFHKITDKPEITLEANPDDINENYINSLNSTPINRLSIGIQSLNDNELKFLNRRHSAKQAINSVKLAQKNGFDNISIDLIYGIPNSNIQSWENSLNIIFELNIQHISAYHLTFEKKTKLYKLLEQHKINEIEEDLSIEQFNLLINKAQQHKFSQYEISNFCKPNFLSKHNSNYWKQKSYIGIGPSAHSYNTTSRQWNVANNQKYIAAIKESTIPYEIETLDIKTKYNDYIITSLRTMWGINLDYINANISSKHKLYCIENAKLHVESNQLEYKNNYLILTNKGKFVSDQIMEKLILVDDL